MPILGGMLASLFGVLFAWLAKRLALGVAAAAAFLATAGAAWLAVKAAIAGIAAGIGNIAPPDVTELLMMFAAFMPSNLAACLTAIMLTDTVVTAYQYWRSNLPTAFKLARGI